MTASSVSIREVGARAGVQNEPESLAGREVVLARAREAGLRCEGVISTSFGCPYEGHVPPARVLEIATALRDAGAEEVAFGDTTGMANPRQVRDFFHSAREQLGADVELTAHFHNTRGQGLANVLAALEAGVASFESSFGELGGCPVPPGATGNIATEDLVSMLRERGIHSGTAISSSSVCASAGRAEASMTRLARPTATAEFESSSSTSCSVAPSSSAGAKTRLRRPIRSASSAPISLAVMISSLARPRPTT